jgi:cytochrome b subunit of formate dehydrogenase
MQPKSGILADTLKEDHIIIILVIFCLILSGMCFTFVFNCVRKLIRDHRIIQVSVTGCLVTQKLVHGYGTYTGRFKGFFVS